MILCFAILFTVKCKYFKGYFDSKYDKRISHLLCVCDLKLSSKGGSLRLLFLETLFFHSARVCRLYLGEERLLFHLRRATSKEASV